MFVRLFVALAVVGLLAGCRPGEPQEDTDVQFSRDAALARDPVAGMRELIQRLHASMKIEGGTVILEGGLVPGSSAVSGNSPWTISCGSGLTVYFDRAEIDLLSSQLSIDDAHCAMLVRRLGQEIRTRMAEAAHA